MLEGHMLQDKESLFNCNHEAGQTKEKNLCDRSTTCKYLQGTQDSPFYLAEEANQSQVSQRSSPPTGFQSDTVTSRLK